MADIDHRKFTKKEKFQAIKAFLGGEAVEIPIGELSDFVATEIEHIEARAEKEKARAEKRKDEGDALREAVESVLTEEYQSADEILKSVQVLTEDESLTKAKITARLAQLVKARVVEKELQKTEDGKKRTFYRLAQDSAEAE